MNITEVHPVFGGLLHPRDSERDLTAAAPDPPPARRPLSSGCERGLSTMKTTRVLSVSPPVADQDAALAFYTEVLGCELRQDLVVPPGVRMIEVVPPGSAVGLVLLPPDSPIPVALRLGTDDADAAYDAIAAADGAVHHNDQVLRWEGIPAMFHFSDPDGNSLVYLEDRAGG